MTPSRIRADVVSERVAWVREMIRRVQGLPSASFADFVADHRNVASAESYIRRGIEALIDLGRHILAKGFAVAVTEYKEIGPRLAGEGVLEPEDGLLMRQIAGYRNRMVHFYREVTEEELYRLCTTHLKDVDHLLEALVEWLRSHPEKLDRSV
jgi:uncharacterized protein YutE (UPF0331/DUF86 family)